MDTKEQINEIDKRIKTLNKSGMVLLLINTGVFFFAMIKYQFIESDDATFWKFGLPCSVFLAAFITIGLFLEKPLHKKLSALMKTLRFEEVWAENDEQFLFERYLEEDNKPQYLVDEAYNLFYCGRSCPERFNTALKLLDKYFSDFPDETENKVPALLLSGKIHFSQKEFDKALEFYKKATEAEVEYGDTNFGAWFTYIQFIAKFEKTELFDEAEKYINAYYDKLEYIESAYTANAVRAFISEKKGDSEKQSYYRKRADDMLKDLVKASRKTRHTNIIKVCDENNDLEATIRGFLYGEGYVFGEKNGVTGWFLQPPHTVGASYIMANYMFDVVSVTVFTLTMEGREMRPVSALRKTVKQLEEMLI